MRITASVPLFAALLDKHLREVVGSNRWQIKSISSKTFKSDIEIVYFLKEKKTWQRVTFSRKNETFSSPSFHSEEQI